MTYQMCVFESKFPSNRYLGKLESAQETLVGLIKVIKWTNKNQFHATVFINL